MRFKTYSTLRRTNIDRLCHDLLLILFLNHVKHFSAHEAKVISGWAAEEIFKKRLINGWRCLGQLKTVWLSSLKVEGRFLRLLTFES